ncbi:probable WRKY transcription factor 15, partial [Vigna umbellata]|uniref:probable WRKY transcription factor 15 n=1 Tax=Vigna umbellata TaxID=87088 RepID=UPI001F5F72B7
MLLQQISPPTEHPFIPKNGPIEINDSSNTIIFSYSNSFISSLTGDTNTKLPSSSSPVTVMPFQITNLSQVSSSEKPHISSSLLKRKCNSDNLGSAKCGSSSSRCHCSKK